MKDMVNVETDRLTVRPMGTEDWRPVQKIWTDQSRSEYAPYDNPKDLSDEAVQTMVRKWAEHQRAGSTSFLWSVSDRKS